MVNNARARLWQQHEWRGFVYLHFLAASLGRGRGIFYRSLRCNRKLRSAGVSREPSYRKETDR